MIVTLSGENSHALHAELSKLTDAFVSTHGEMAIERIDGETASWERMQESVQSAPFLADRKMVLLQSPGANKQFAAKVDDFLKAILDTTDVLLVEPKLDKRGTYYKVLKKATDFREFPLLEAADLTAWLTTTAKANGGTLSQQDARLLVERVGTNQLQLESELHKLLLYAPEVTRASIELLTEAVPQNSIFDLLEAAFAGDTPRAVQQYWDLREQRVDTAQIIALLAWQLRVLILLKLAGNRPPQEVATATKISPFVIRKSQATARRLSLERLKEHVGELLEIDVRSKRERFETDDALQLFFLKLAA